MLYVQPPPDCAKSLFVPDVHLRVRQIRTTDLVQSVDRLDIYKHISLSWLKSSAFVKLSNYVVEKFSGGIYLNHISVNKEKKELEIVAHTAMKHLKVFVVDMGSRCPHGHGDLELGILLGGGLELFVDNARYTLSAGDIYLISRYQVHSFQACGETARILAFQIRENFYQEINPDYHFLQIRQNVIVPNQSVLYQTIQEALFHCANAYFSQIPYSDLDCAVSILQILHSILRENCAILLEKKVSNAQKSSSLRLNRIMDYIAAHYQEPLSLETIASMEGITVPHASHFIKNTLGITFQEYVNIIRFEHALRLVERSDLPILDICMETGFSSSRYLNQAFQKHLGMSVKEYKKSPERPAFVSAVLPGENRQTAYSQEQSAFLYQRYKEGNSISRSIPS